MRKALATLLLVFAAHPAFAATVHIVAFGDSNTAGYLVPRNQSYPAQLQAALRAKGHDVVVENAGISGDTAAGALRRFDSAVRPDTNIAIVEFGINDVRSGATMATVRERLRGIIRALQARHIEVLLVGSGPMKVPDVARANGVAYAQWNVPGKKYRARDGQHLNAQGYAIVVRQMLPQVETLVKRVSPR
jgi:acyl-CoA thioesterase-1